MPGIACPPGYPAELQKYVTMLKVGIPSAAVKGKLASDGFDDDTYDKYLNPDTAITLNQPEEDNENENENENDDDDDGGDDEKREEFDPLDPNQAIPVEQSQNQEQKQQQPQQQQSTGYFSNNNYVPPPDSELKMGSLQPVPIKKTLLIVNTFVVNTASFLNKFVAKCESKLHRIHTDIERMETTLQLLETKLSSISWLAQAEKGQAPVIPNVESWDDMKEEKQSSDNQPSGGGGGGGGGDNAQQPPQEQQEEAPAQPAKPAEDPLLSDPEMIPWFKMLKVGVPEQAARNKMSASGLSDDIIDRVVEIHRNR